MGTGVAPLRSALRHVLKRKDEFGQLVVLYGARTPDDFCYRDETENWEDAGVELRQVISRPDGHDWSGPTGYVNHCWTTSCRVCLPGRVDLRLARDDRSNPRAPGKDGLQAGRDPDELLNAVIAQ